MFALERDFASLYTFWVELSQNQFTTASALSQNTQNNQLPKKFVCYRKRRHTDFLIEIGEKDTKLSSFYLMNPANSNSREN